MKFLICWFVVIQIAELTCAQKSFLLYKVNDLESIYILDKSNKLVIDDQKLDFPFKIFDQNGLSYLYSDDKYILLGQVNQVLNISLKTEHLDKIKINFEKSLTISDRDNQIKVGIPISSSPLNVSLITCGANEAKCRIDNKIIDNLYTLHIMQSNNPTNNKINNQNIAPFSHLNSIYFFHSNSQVTDMFKQNYLIDTNEIDVRKMTRLPPGAIKNTNFRSSYGHEDKVYVFLSESEMILQNGVYFKTFESFIGEVCADDDGKNTNELAKRFVTFKKTIINCYLPDYDEMVHTKYTEIQEATRPIEIQDENTGEKTDVFYAIFTLRRSNEVDSAVCMYRISTIKQSMSGFFKNNQDKLPRRPLESCSHYKNLTPTQIDTYYKNITKYSKYQMDETINQRAFFALKNVKFTSIGIDYRFKTHVIYLGTSDGRVFKVINKETKISGGHTQPVILAELKVFDSNEPILKIKISENYLILISGKLVKKLNTDFFCQNFKTCSECYESEDPDCKWSDKECIRTDFLESKTKCVNSRFDKQIVKNDFKIEINTKGDDQERGQFSLGSLFTIFFLTFCLTCIITCLFTFYFIKKYYKLIEKDDEIEKNRIFSLLKSASLKNRSLAVKKKLLNCYETQPVVCVNHHNSPKPESASNSPFILTSSSSTSTHSNSPNFIEKNEIYLSDESFKSSNLIRIC
ncbi:unnamed protein product [Brachionus calyciflorus]|uniref:Sema domain-containing protein n=1 Tax=Brachionus calyciflorus TaxID=104777 RepID=A0A813TA83_9BILA|nr:unnamed protein product [Brachionus calyciflorus]